MNRVNELKTILSKNFNWNKARLDCFCRALLALYKVRTVNLSELAVGFESKAHVDSRYKRLVRFFRQFEFNYEQLAYWVVEQFFASQSKLTLIIDRTNWFWGSSKINVLMLAIAYEGVAIPVCWELLDKAGIASAAEHQRILERFVQLFGKERIATVLGDREFASGELFGWFNEQGIPFHIRIKENSNAWIYKAKCTAEEVFRHLNPAESQAYVNYVQMFGQKVRLAGSRSEKGELMIVATNQDPKNAVAIYLRRWEIENLFQSLKSRGFRFEETHLTYLDRIEKLIGLLTVALCWAHKVGEWKSSTRPIRLNRFGRQVRPQNSYFRYGLDIIRESILQIGYGAKNFLQVLKCLITKPLRKSL